MESLETVEEFRKLNLEMLERPEYPEKLTEDAKDFKEDIREFHSGNNEGIELLSDRETVEKVVSGLEKMENLKFENWCNLSVEERTALLNEAEKMIAKIEHRPPLAVGVEKMNANDFGYQCASENRIALNSKYVCSNSYEAYKEVVDTIIHEGRHAYQHYNVDVRCVHDSESEVKTWQENFYDPKYKYYTYEGQKIIVRTRDGYADYGFRIYYYQPVEIDARNFTSDVMSKLQKDGYL